MSLPGGLRSLFTARIIPLKARPADEQPDEQRPDPAQHSMAWREEVGAEGKGGGGRQRAERKACTDARSVLNPGWPGKEDVSWNRRRGEGGQSQSV